MPPERLAACHAVVVGVGAIGRQVALQLAAVGVPRLDLVDDDLVAEENLAPQAYWPADLGRRKVDATADVCRRILPELRVAVHGERFRRSMARTLPAFADPAAVQPVVFCCVDSMEARRLVWESVRARAAFWADGRMAAEVLRVLASGRPESDEAYPKTLFADAAAYAGSCTARSTVYTAGIAAGLMLTQFTKWLRGLPVDGDVMLNLLSAELTVG